MTTLCTNIHINIIHDSKKYKQQKCLRMSEEMERVAWMQQPLPFIIMLETGSSILLWLAWNLRGMKFCFVVHHRYTKLSEAGQVTKNRSCRALCARIPENSPSQGLGRRVTGNWGRRGRESRVFGG